MPISDDTVRRIKELREVVNAIMDTFQVPEDRAWQMAAANGSYKAVETAKRMDERARKNELARLHALAADLATQKAQLDVDK
jgi:hypothetical protein